MTGSQGPLPGSHYNKLSGEFAALCKRHPFIAFVYVYCFSGSRGPEAVRVCTDQRAEHGLDRWLVYHRVTLDIQSPNSSIPDLHDFGMCEETVSTRGTTQFKTLNEVRTSY